MNGSFYKALELIVSETVLKPVLSLMVDGASYMYMMCRET